jgi:hypothetical protein
MKKSRFLLLLVALIVSCVGSNQIVEIDAPDKDIKSIKLVQTQNAYKTERQTGRIYDVTYTRVCAFRKNTLPN